MTNTWLTRRSVRNPVSRLTTSLISSSVCRLPFMSRSARPSRTSSTARAAAAWLCGTSAISYCSMSSPHVLATVRIRSTGPTRIGAMMPARAASTTAPSEASSHGCATAVGLAVRAEHARQRRQGPRLVEQEQEELLPEQLPALRSRQALAGQVLVADLLGHAEAADVHPGLVAAGVEQDAHGRLAQAALIHPHPERRDLLREQRLERLVARPHRHAVAGGRAKPDRRLEPGRAVDR